MSNVEMNKALESQELSEEQLKAMDEAAKVEKELEQAASQYMMLTKEICGRAGNMGAGGLARVIKAYARFPFSQLTPKFINKNENELFLLMLSNAKAKGILTKGLAEEAKQLEDMAVGNVTDEILNSVKPKGENNGENMDQSGNN